MTLDRWKGTFWTVELIVLITSGLLQFCQAQGSGGSNFFYYYSPTQRTHVTQTFGQTQAPSNPFFNNFPTNPPSPLIGYPPLESTSIQPINPNPAPQQYIYRTPAGTTYSPLPSFSQLSLGLQQQAFPNYQVPQDESQNTASTTSFSTFSRFGKNAFTNHAQLPQQSPQNLLASQRRQTTVQPQSRGTYSFFESPFQYIQQRQLEQVENPATTPAPVVTSTSTPNIPDTYLEADEGETLQRKPKFSSRFRYVEPQVNPYSHLTRYTSDLPYTERRFYSTVIPSAPTPTGYSFSIGGDDGNGPKASVHVSMGPLSNTQHLTEITGSQFARHPQSFRTALVRNRNAPEIIRDEGQGAFFQMTRDEKSESSATTITTSTTPVPEHAIEDLQSISVLNANSTVETLIKEPSVQTETIASPKSENSVKLDEINIPQRLGKRRKVARKRLQLDETEVSGADTASEGRRRISQNRLPESPKEVNDSPKGSPADVVPSSTQSQNQLDSVSVNEQQEFSPHTPPEENFPSSSTTSSSLDAPPSPVQIPFTEATPSTPDNEQIKTVSEQKQEDYYEYDNTNSDNQPSKSIENSASEDEAPLPILRGVSKEDYPGVFNDNSLETERGEILTRHKTSQPAISSASTTESSSSADADSVEKQSQEQPSPNLEPAFSSTSTTTESLATSSTTTSTTEQPPIESQEHVPALTHEDSAEHLPTQAPVTTTTTTTTTSTTTTELPELEVPHFEVIEVAQPDREIEAVPADNISLQNDNQSTGSSTSTLSPGTINDSQNTPDDTTSPPKEINPVSESAVSDDGDQQQLPPSDNGRIDDELDASLSSTTTTQPTTSDTSTEIASTTEHESDDFDSYSQEELPDEEQEIVDQVSSDEEIGKAQRVALQETLKRLRDRQQRNNDTSSTSSSSAIDEQETSNVNKTIVGNSGGRRRSRYFRRKPLQLANLTLPTSGPLPNQNALFEDEEGDSRSQVIEKIQKFRANVRRVSSTTKRPRRVTRPSSDRVVQKVKLDQVDSFSNSSSAGVDSYIPSPRRTFPKPTYDTSTTERLPSTLLPLPDTTTVTTPTTTEETESEYSPFPPTTTTTTTDPVNRMMVPTTEATTVTTTESTTTTLTSRTTLPSTTGSTTTEYVEEDNYRDDYELDQVREPKFIASDDANTHLTTLSTTPSEGVYPTTPMTPTTTTTATTTTATAEELSTGQLIIHEILPTQPPLKEISFVVGESVEDEEASKSVEETLHDEGQANPSISTVVRVEAKVEVSSSVSRPEPVLKSDDNETISMENADDAKGSPTGKKVRVVVVRQRKVNSSRKITTSNGEVRRRRKISRLGNS